MRREFATPDGSYIGKLVVYRVEFFYTQAGGGSGDKEVVDEWEVEDWRYPDLTAADYMETSDWWEMTPNEDGIIVTLFRDGIAVSSVWWYKDKLNGREAINRVF